MKFNDINLIGTFKLKGVVGDNNQVISYKDGEPDWVKATEPPPIVIRGLGNNFTLVESIPGDPIASGNNLIQGYEIAKKLADEIVASVNNRVTVFIMPGDYDVYDSQLLLNKSFVDLIGVSSNPRSTIIRSGLNDYTIIYNGVDSKLQNVDLRSGIYLSVRLLNNPFLRWENLILSGTCFWDGLFEYAGTDLRGTFKNIVVKQYTNFAVVENSIDVVCENIYFEGNSGYTFYSQNDGQIQGTFSDITFEFVEGPVLNHNAFSDYEMILNINNFTVLSGFGGFLYSGGTLSGNFTNMNLNFVLGGPNTLFSSSKSITGKFENININSTSESIFGATEDIISEFKNININLANPSLGLFGSGGEIIATMSNITIEGSSINSFLTCQNRIHLNCDDFRVNVFVLTMMSILGGSISGNYKNFEIFSVTQMFNCSSLALSSITGNYQNFYIEKLGGSCFKLNYGLLNCDIKNFNIYEYEPSSGFMKNQSFDLTTPTSIDVRIDGLNISSNIGNSSDEVLTASIIYGDYKNINISKVDQFLNGLTVSVTVDRVNIDTLNAASITGNNSLVGTFSNFRIKESCTDLFRSNDGYVNLYVDELYIKSSVSGDLFNAYGDLRGVFKNIQGYNLANDYIFTSVIKSIDIEVYDSIFKNNGTPGTLFYAGDGIFTGTFSNIEIGPNFFNICGNATSSTINIKDSYIRSTTSGLAFDGPKKIKADNLQLFNSIDGYNEKFVLSNSVFVDPTATPINSNITITTSAVIENSDIYYSTFEAKIPGGQNINFSIRNSITGTISNAHILHSSMINPPAGSRYSDGSEYPFGVTALSPSFNVFSIPRPKELN